MPRARLNPQAYALAVRELQHGASTEAEIGEATGLADRTVRDFMHALHKAGAAHIVGWEKDARDHWRTPVWKLGAGRDAELPVGYSGVYHRARKLSAAHGVTTKAALAVLREVGGRLDQAHARLTRQAAPGA